MKNYISAQLEHVCWLLKPVRVSFILDQSPSYPWFNMNLLDEFFLFHLCLFAESGVPLVASIHELLSRHRTSTQSQGQTIISESDRVDQVTLVDLKRVNTKWLADSQAFPSCIACTWPSSTYSVPITICLEELQGSDSFHSVHSPICRPVFSKCNLKIKYLRRVMFRLWSSIFIYLFLQALRIYRILGYLTIAQLTLSLFLWIVSQIQEDQAKKSQIVDKNELSENSGDQETVRLLLAVNFLFRYSILASF